MKDIKEMTLKEAVSELSEILVDYGGSPRDYDRFEQLYEKITDEAVIDVDKKYLVAEICICNDNESYSIITNSVSGAIFDAWIFYGKRFPGAMNQIIYYAQRDAIHLRCILANLRQIKDELKPKILKKVIRGHYIADFQCLLANPRKNVVEWALKHKDYLNYDFQDRNFAKYNQKNPELRKLILKTLD